MAAKQSKPRPGKKRIAIVTGTRAEFGMLQTVIDALHAKKGIDVSLIVTGTHLTTGTWRDVKRSGYTIARKVTMQKVNQPSKRGGDTGYQADVEALGRGVTGLGRAFDELEIDLVMVLGDRIEALAAANAATIGGRHLAHIHGGDRAEGVADESMRHAISHLAHLHFPATRLSEKRLVRMGIEPSKIYQTGSPAIDQLKEVSPALDAPALIVLKHPVGDTDAKERGRMAKLIRLVSQMHKKGELNGWPLFLAPNSDPGAVGMREAYASHFKSPVMTPEIDIPHDPSCVRWSEVFTDGWYTHLPRDIFLSLLSGAGMLIGNTSCGLIEAAALGVPAINLGNRQSGREKPKSVIDHPDLDSAKAVASLKTTIQAGMKARQKASARRQKTRIYGAGNTGLLIAEILAKLDLSGISLRKRLTY